MSEGITSMTGTENSRSATKAAKKAGKAVKKAKKAAKKAAKAEKKAERKAVADATEENIALVREFLKALEASDISRACAMLSDHAVYHNIPVPAIRGRKRIEGTLTSMMRFAKDFRAVNVNIAANGSAVLTERIDSMVIGGLYVELPVMGTFEVRDGKIIAWRDYFDMIQFFRQLAGALPGLLKFLPGISS